MPTADHFAADLRSVTDSDFRPVSAVVVGSSAARSWPSAAGWIAGPSFDPDFGSIDSVIALAGSVAAVVVGSAVVAAADFGFDLCCRNCSAIEIVAGPDLDFVRCRFVADFFCFVVVEAVG